MIFWVALGLCFLSGYFALSQEILWVHAVSYATGGNPRDFAHVLAAFLVGIGVGSWLTTRLPHRDTRAPVVAAFQVSGAVSYLALPALARLYTVGDPDALSVVAEAFVFVVALAGGFTFPLLCDFAAHSNRRAGTALSYLYFANIVGSVLGPILTAFVLMDRMPLDRLMFLVSAGLVVTAVLAAALIGARTAIVVSAVGGVFLAIAFALHPRLYSHLLERLHYKRAFATERAYQDVVETRSGIVAIAHDGLDTVYGGGVYDGRFNVDPVNDTNGIRRAFAVAILHANPERVLQIGLASGSWTRVVASHPRVEQLDIIEINPGYLAPIDRHADQRPILEDPKVNIHIDDGRRWLNRHPGARYDLVLVNATFHRRSQTTNLLSAEFLGLCKKHLRPAGVVYYNATQSEDVLYTASRVYSYVTTLGGFVAASDVPFAMKREQRVKNLLAYPFFDRAASGQTNPGALEVLDELADTPLVEIGFQLRARKDLWLVTDDNMAIEFRGRPGLFHPSQSWWSVLASLSRVW